MAQVAPSSRSIGRPASLPATTSSTWVKAGAQTRKWRPPGTAVAPSSKSAIAEQGLDAAQRDLYPIGAVVPLVQGFRDLEQPEQLVLDGLPGGAFPTREETL